jgi:hypothetical protein
MIANKKLTRVWKEAVMAQLKYRIFLLLSHQAQQLYHTESQHLLDHPVTSTSFRTAITATHCTVSTCD